MRKIMKDGIMHNQNTDSGIKYINGTFTGTSEESKQMLIVIAEKAIGATISERNSLELELNIIIGKAYLDLGLAAYDDNCDDKRQLYAGAGENYINGTFTVTSEQSKQMYFAIAEKMGTDNIPECSYLPEPYKGVMGQPVDGNQGTANESAASHIKKGGGSGAKEAASVTTSGSADKQVVDAAEAQLKTEANSSTSMENNWLDLLVLVVAISVTAVLVCTAVYLITPAIIGHALAQAGPALTTSILPAVAAFMLTPTGIGTGIGLLLGTIALVGYLTTPKDNYDKFTVKKQELADAVDVVQDVDQVDTSKDATLENANTSNSSPSIGIKVALAATAVTAGLVGLATYFAITPAVIGHALAQAGAALTTSILPAVAAFMLTPTGIGLGIGLLLAATALAGYLSNSKTSTEVLSSPKEAHIHSLNNVLAELKTNAEAKQEHKANLQNVLTELRTTSTPNHI